MRRHGRKLDEWWSRRPFTLTRFVLSYSLALISVAIIFSVAYVLLLRTVREVEVENALTNLERVRDQVDTGIGEVRATATRLALDPGVRRVSSLSLESYAVPEFYRIIDFQRSFPAYALTNTFIDQVYVMINSVGAIVGRESATTRLRSFFNSVLHYENFNYEQWLSEMEYGYFDRVIWPSQAIDHGDRTSSYVTYLQSFPIGQRQRPRGTVIILIGTESLHSLFEGIRLGDVGWYSIADGDRMLLSSTGSARPDVTLPVSWNRTRGVQKEGNILVVHTLSTVTGLTYAAGIPEAVVLQRVSRVRALLVYAVIAALVVGMILTAVFAMRQGRPIAAVVSSNAALREIVERQKPVVRAGAIERVLRGSYHRFADMEPLLSQVGLDASATKLAVCLFRVASSESREVGANFKRDAMNRAMCLEVVGRRCTNVSATHPIEADKVAVLLCLESVDAFDGVLASVDAIVHELHSEHGVSAHCGVSRPCRGLWEVSTAFHEAEQALDYRGTHRGHSVLTIADVPTESRGYYFPIELELRFIRLVSAGDAPEALQLWKSVYQRNFVDSDLTQQEIEQLTAMLAGTLDRVSRNMSPDLIPPQFERLVNHVRSAETVESLDDAVRELVEGVTAVVDSAKASRNSHLRDGIVQFIRDNYADANLSLGLLSSTFDRSEKYLSDFFKEQTGISYYQYLVALRIEKARELIERGLPVSEVAVMVGYNRKSFSRAFRRIMGVSPSEYRRTAVG